MPIPSLPQLAQSAPPGGLERPMRGGGKGKGGFVGRMRLDVGSINPPPRAHQGPASLGQPSVKPITPSAALSTSALPLTDEQVLTWREQGYVVVDGLLPTGLVMRARAALEHVFPDGAGKFRGIGNGKATFPSPNHGALNELALQPRVSRAAAQLLGTADLRLSQFEGWAKDPPSAYDNRPASAAYDNSDQRMHMDYPNNYLTHPSAWEHPEAVCILFYFSDAADCGGMTRVVPRQGPSDEAYQWPYLEMPGVGRHEWLNDRATTEAYFKANDPRMYHFRQKLYERERAVCFRPGTALLYRLDTWHRGAPMRTGGSSARRVVNMMIRRGDAEWITTWNQGVARSVYAGADEIICRATPEQRSLLGFPAPGHPYWSAATIAATRARYGEAMDMYEYEAALQAAKSGAAARHIVPSAANPAAPLQRAPLQRSVVVARRIVR